MNDMRYVACSIGKATINPIAMFKKKEDALSFHRSNGYTAIVDMNTGVDIRAPIYTKKRLIESTGIPEHEAEKLLLAMKVNAQRIREWCSKERKQP